MLKEALPEAKTLLGPKDFIFQQNNAPIYTASVVKVFLEAKNLHLLNWPSYIPGLNTMENLRGYIVFKFYEGEK